MTERDDAARKAILARRARFVTAAVAGIGIACGKEPAPPPPTVCLSIEATPQPDAQPTSTTNVQDAGAQAEPMPCLSVAAEAVDAGPTTPRVCLRMVPPRGSK